MGCCEFSWTWFLWAFLFYKVVDLLIRFPKRSGPSSVVNNILITGCDTGFGRLTALRLDRMGFSVFAACLTEEGKESLAKASGTGRINAFLMDVTKTESIEAAYEHVCKSLPAGVGLWGIVNNAGLMPKNTGPLEWLKREDFRFCFEVNVFGMAEVTRIFLPLVKKTKGRIVCTSSVAGIMGFINTSAYSSSKHAVEGLCSSIRPELSIFGIKVHVIEPGYHLTSLLDVDKFAVNSRTTWERLSSDLKEEYPEDYSDKLIKFSRDFTLKIASSRLDGVVDAYEHALLSFFPRGRYLVGKDAKYFFWPLSNMPEWVHNRVSNMNPNRPVPKSCQ